MTCVLERAGRYHRTLHPGFHLRTPLLDRVRERIDMRVHVVSVPAQHTLTRDNLAVSITCGVYLRVSDPYKATYTVENFIQAAEQLMVSLLQKHVSEIDVAELNSVQETVESRVAHELRPAIDEWGVELLRVSLQEIEPPASIRAEVERRMLTDNAEREHTRRIESAKQATIAQAEAERQAAILRAEGEAESMRILARAREETHQRASGTPEHDSETSDQPRAGDQ